MQNNFIIGQISDTHFVDKKHKLFDQYDTYKRFVDTIETCNQLMKNPDLYIISGDLIHDDEIFYKDFIVFISSYFGFMLYDQLQVIDGVADTKPSTNVFVDKPDF